LRANWAIADRAGILCDWLGAGTPQKMCRCNQPIAGQCMLKHERGHTLHSRVQHRVTDLAIIDLCVKAIQAIREFGTRQIRAIE
jgi:hypothetical protein